MLFMFACQVNFNLFPKFEGKKKDEKAVGYTAMQKEEWQDYAKAVTGSPLAQPEEITADPMKGWYNSTQDASENTFDLFYYYEPGSYLQQNFLPASMLTGCAHDTRMEVITEDYHLDVCELCGYILNRESK